MRHHFATWSEHLAPAVRARYEVKLRSLETVLSEACDETPEAIRDIYFVHQEACMPAAALETALAALECAAVCRHSHPADFLALCAVMKVLLKGQMPIDGDGSQRMLEFLAETDPINPKAMPAAEVIGQVERWVAGQSLPAAWRPLLKSIHQAVARSATKPSKSVESLLERISRLSSDSIASRLKADDGWADLMAQDLAATNAVDRPSWDAFLSHASTVAPEPPAKEWDVKSDELESEVSELDAREAERDQRLLGRRASSAWTETSLQRIAAIGVEPFRAQRLKWLRAVPDSKPSTLSQFSVNREVLRGILCTCEHNCDAELASAVRVAADFFYRNNSPLARIAVWVLTRMAGSSALEELTSLARQVKVQSQARLIEAGRALVASKTGVALHTVNEPPLPALGFGPIGRRVDRLSDFTAEITLTPTGSVDLRWFKPNGVEQKSIPAQVKRAHEVELRSLKTAIKEVEATLAAARGQLDAAPLGRRSWSLEEWRTRYFDHPVAGTVGRRIIWAFEEGGCTAAGAFDGRELVNREGQPLEMAATARVSVWHPLGAPVDQILQWRDRLAAAGVTQPLKQAYREVYVLTDAERGTGTYSNRFAAHVLNQSQFRALAKARRWTASYLGSWSGGEAGISERRLPEWQLRAELWTLGTGDGFTNDYTYVTTDQVRFSPIDSHDPLPLDQVPPLVFSEVMRDVDLFVGVASVGNDPEWQDGGPEGRHAAYWQNYSFGELSESALSRRAALQRIIPQLAIADRCKFSDRFLVVRGEKRTYRIHLGSGNIQMEPDNRYLCIVPAQGSKIGDMLYLPFEGDSRLSIILSKALLLADDASIKDPSIVRQIVAG